MTDQYQRIVRLVIGKAGGEAIDFKDLHIRFTVRNAVVETLKQADIRIFNVNQDTAKKIRDEYTRIELQAGYGDNVGTIFQGEVAMVKVGRENVTDSFVDIVAQDGDSAYNKGTINVSLARGWTQEDYYNEMMKALAPFGVKAGYKPSFDSNPATRGTVLFGMVRDHMRSFADTHKCFWNIEDGSLNLMPYDATIPGVVPVITTATGLVGSPVQTIQGIEVQCLLNPLVRASGQVQINNKSVNTEVQRENYMPGGQAPLPVAGLDGDGYYKSACVTHVGDTRGEAFYTYIVGTSVDKTAQQPLTGPTFRATPDGP